MIQRLGERLGLRPGEARTVILAFASFFCLLSSYYILPTCAMKWALPEG